MLIKDLMRTDVICFREQDRLSDVLDTLVSQRLHGAPVVDEDGKLTGVISQQDVFFSGMTTDENDESPMTVKDVMTAPPVFAAEDSSVVDLCRMMYSLRIHRVPIVNEGKVVGIVSSLDVCAAIAEKKKLDG